MLIVQNVANPAAVRHAIVDALSEDVSRLAICSAYVSSEGSRIFVNCCREFLSEDQFSHLPKALVTSFDFGITDPEAIRYWSALPNTEILVAGAEAVRAGSLIPAKAFHPKMYAFSNSDQTANIVIGSANLTSRGFTINTEAVWLERNVDAHVMSDAWCAAIQEAVPLDDGLLRQYEALRARVPRSAERVELERVPAPHARPRGELEPFPDAVFSGQLTPEAFEQMWVHGEGLQGGSGNQLELPRGANRFFGFQFDNYDSGVVEHIGDLSLVSGAKHWDGRPLTWHGDNGMERINLPTRAQGGFDYRDSAILFRRLPGNSFELVVAEWESDLARAWRQASAAAAAVYRLGRRTPRIVGLI